MNYIFIQLKKKSIDVTSNNMHAFNFLRKIKENNYKQIQNNFFIYSLIKCKTVAWDQHSCIAIHYTHHKTFLSNPATF